MEKITCKCGTAVEHGTIEALCFGKLTDRWERVQEGKLNAAYTHRCSEWTTGVLEGNSNLLNNIITFH